MGKLIIVFVVFTTILITVVVGRNRTQKGFGVPAPSFSRPSPPLSLRSALYEGPASQNWPPAASGEPLPQKPKNPPKVRVQPPRWKTPPLVLNMNDGELVLAPTNYTGKTLPPVRKPPKNPSSHPKKRRKGGSLDPPLQGEGSSSSRLSDKTKRLPSPAKYYCKSGTEQYGIYDYNFDSHNTNPHPAQITSGYPFVNPDPGQFTSGNHNPYPGYPSINTHPSQYPSGDPYFNSNPGYPSTNAFSTSPTIPSSSVPDCTLDQYIGMGLRYNQIKTKSLTLDEWRRLEELKPQLSTPPPSPLVFNDDE